MKQPASYYRHRIGLIRELLKALPPVRGEINSPRELLHYGYISPSLEVEDELADHATQASNTPLSFVEQFTYNTWFVMHPDKVCGTESPTTSIHFPVKVTGSKDDVLKAINATLQNRDNGSTKRDEVHGNEDREKKKKLLALKIKIKAQAMKMKLNQNLSI